jgi:hypothetical protein
MGKGQISMGGCYIDSYGRAEVGETIKFEVDLHDGNHIKLSGEVTYTNPNLGFSVCFLNLNEDQRQTLVQMIDQRVEAGMAHPAEEAKEGDIVRYD